MTKRFLYFLVPIMLLIVGCSESELPVKGRWYTQSQISDGATAFKKHCASCHGEQAQGLTTDWRRPLSDGSYPPPPLDGTAHAWHHQISVLMRTIQNGGISLGGKMPPFNDKLNDDEIKSVIAFFQNKWDDKIYNIWIERGGLK